MPELPEAETIRAGLERAALGRTIAGVHFAHPRVLRRFVGTPEAAVSMVEGQQVTAVARRGKFLWLELGESSAAALHLGMSGQFRVTDGEDPVLEAHPHRRAALTLDDGTVLTFLDQRTFGYITPADLVETGDGFPGGHGTSVAAVPCLAQHIARDLLDPHLDRAALTARTKAKNTEIKRAMLDQTLVSGLGNIYCDEALHRARIHPRRLASKTSKPALNRLWDESEAVLRTALAEGGTSFDALYVNVNGESGYFSRSLRVYGQAGRPCVECGMPIKRIAFAGRSSHFCPHCQRR